MIFLQKISAILALIFLSPLLLILWILVKATSAGPGFYCSRRLGVNRKIIHVWKFRTMYDKVPVHIRAGIKHSPEWLAEQKQSNDVRITPVGKWLRRFSLDELPQIWNVLNGTMNWIGPRPIVLDEEHHYGRWSTKIHSVKPGITGLWQVMGRNLVCYHRRIAINLYYVRHQSWKLDTWIILRTFGAVFGGKGAF